MMGNTLRFRLAGIEDVVCDEWARHINGRVANGQLVSSAHFLVTPSTGRRSSHHHDWSIEQDRLSLCGGHVRYRSRPEPEEPNHNGYGYDRNHDQ
jgi:hypothetical protein